MISLIAFLSGLISGLAGLGDRVIMIMLTGPRKGGNPVFPDPPTARLDNPLP